MKFIYVFFSVLLLTLSSCQRELDQEPVRTHQIKLTFRNKVDSSVMQLENSYQNAFGENFTLHMFKYYVSNIRLQNAAGSWFDVDGNFHLVDEALPSSKSFSFSVPGADFTAISFLLGVDSMHNVSGTQTGDLDPAKGMFWTWSTGYVMAKMEATSPVSTAPNNDVAIHIGGFKTGENTTRQITPSFPAGTSIHIQENGLSEIVVQANLNTWFKGTHDLRIADNPVCTNAGELAVKFADNYSNMFKIVTINN